MTIHIKHRSGGSIVELAKLWHDSIADMYRAKYEAVPVKVRKRRKIGVRGMIQLRRMQLRARDIVIATRHHLNGWRDRDTYHLPLLRIPR